jgi:site-specific recombinase XerD
MKQLKPEEIKRLIFILPEQYRLLFLTTYYHGLRASEAVGITPNNVRDGELIIKRLKGSNETCHPLMTNAEYWLNEKLQYEELLKTKKKTERLFPITRFKFRYLMRKYGKQIGLPEKKCHPHILKHSIAKNLIDKMPPNELQCFMGWRNFAMIGEYTKPDEEEVATKVAGILNL